MNELCDLIHRQLRVIHLSDVKVKVNKLEKKDGILEEYTQWLKEVLPKCKHNFDEYNKSLNLLDKVENLHEMIKNSENTERTAWRFCDDSNKSIDALIVDDKRRLVNRMIELNAQHDMLIQSLEQELEHKSQEFRQEFNKLDVKLE